jgi:hypothetical protein
MQLLANMPTEARNKEEQEYMKAVAEPINEPGGKPSFNPGDASARSYSNSLYLAVTCPPREVETGTPRARTNRLR